MTCTYCGRPVDPTGEHYIRVAAWVRMPKRDAPTLREVIPGLFAHRGCVLTRSVLGEPVVGQGGLFGREEGR